MAEKRMFSLKIIDSDSFCDMPATSQNLYFHLAMRADDEGFINKPKLIAKSIGANDNDFDVLVAKGFLIGFESKIFVIKHWWMHNYIRGDRVKSTSYTEERGLLEVKENGTYTMCQTVDCQVAYECQASIEEIRLDKFRLEENNNVCEGSLSDFDLFWKHYPNKVGKEASRKAWKKNKNKPPIEKIIEAVDRYLKSKSVIEGYIKNPATWINGSHWDDEIVPYQPKQPKTGVMMSAYDALCAEREAKNNFIEGEIA